MRRGIGRLRAGGSSGDADASAWAAAVTANGGTYSAATLAAVTAFAVSAKASGYWTKLNRINLFCGNQLAAALVPLKVGGGSATDTNVSFVSGDYTEATGLTGNASTKYLDTGLVPSVSLTTNDTHIAVYGRVNADTNLGEQPNFRLLNAAGTQSSDQYDNVSGRVSGAASPVGFVIGTRTAAAVHTIYRNGGQVATNATTGGALPAFSFFIYALNNSGTPASFSAPTLAAYSIGSGLTGADVTAYYTHMQTFQTSLSRNV